MSPGAHQRGETIIQACRRVGFAIAGIAPAQPSDYADQLRRWLDDGKHGSMHWLAKHTEQRTDPCALMPGAKSIILVADRYAPRGDTDEQHTDAPNRPAHARARIARYARGRDYHKVIKKRLHSLADALRQQHPDQQFRAFVDTAPVLEREHSARAGMGWIGKHTLLIHPRIGSYTLLGGLLTTMRIEPPEDQTRVADHCGTCTRCIDACPTRAISPYSVDATRCISYLTIEHRGRIDPAFHEPIGDWVFGCDICQEVCPHNSPRPEQSPEPVSPEYAPRRTHLDILDVLRWDEQARREAFTASAMKRARLDMIKRNALIVAGNAIARGDAQPELRQRIRDIAADDSEPSLVRTTAADVLRRLDHPHAQHNPNPLDTA